MNIEFLTVETMDVVPQARLHIINNGPAVISIWPETGRTPSEQIDCIENFIRDWDTQVEEDVPLRILSTSPYILRAVEVCAARYSIADQVVYRRMTADGTMDTVDTTEELYRPWAEAFQKLDAMQAEIPVAEDTEI